MRQEPAGPATRSDPDRMSDLGCWERKMKTMLLGLKRFYRDEEGATAVEYGMMVALIAAVIVATVGVLGGQINTAFCTIVTNLGGTCP